MDTMCQQLRHSHVLRCTPRWSSVRLFSTRRLPPHKLMPMPRLSPRMQQGVINKWLIPAGAEINMCDLVCDVATDELLEDSSERFVLEVESHEDGFLAKVLVPEGGQAAPDQPIAVVCELVEDVPEFADFQPRTEEVVPAGSFCWQAYVKQGDMSKGCS